MRLCNIEISTALYELRYDGECNHYHVITNVGDEIMTPEEYANFFGWSSVIYGAPRLDDVAYWLREKHDIYIATISDICSSDKSVCFYSEIRHRPKIVFFRDVTDLYKDYDDALESAITKALEIIKNKQHENSKI